MIDKLQADIFMKKVSEKGIVLDLEPLKNMCRILGDPQNRIPCVHISGTNGKGSVLSMVNAGLIEAGLRVGRFFSPQIFDDEPAAAINNSPIDETLRLDVLEQIITVYRQMEARGEETPTVFEIETLCALMCFTRAECDIVVVECGMGGLGDATNIIDSNAVCVFTSIGLDHMNYLGSTPAEIAENKAEILRNGSIAVCAVQSFPETVGAVSRKSRQVGSPLIYCEKAKKINFSGFDGQTFDYKGKQYRIALCGEHQCENASAAIETLIALRSKGFIIPDESIRNGLEKAVWHGRFECVKRDPHIILDGAHNVPAAKALAEAIDKYLGGKKLVLLLGVLADKQYAEITDILAPKADMIVTFTPPNSRALDGESLRMLCGKYAPSIFAETIEKAVRLAVESAGKDGAVCAAGSLYSLGEIRKALDSLDISPVNELSLSNRIVKNLLFITKMAEIRRLERDRIFCRHDISHCMDVARLTMLICAEEGIQADRDTVYAAALLHDIGRAEEYVSGTPHDFAGIETAARILTQLDCPPELSREIIRLIACHRDSKGKKNQLEAAFYRADKQSRLCFACPAQDECCWDDSKKNMKITR